MKNLANFVVGAEWLWIAIAGIIIGVVVDVAVRKKKNKVEIGLEDVASNPEEGDEHNKKALSILKQRLAKGEISKEAYDKLKNEFQN